jgi:hypothetical protein
MADISSFLSEGQEIPAGSAFKALQSQTVLPEWYTNYGMQLLSNQQALMNQPYQSYAGPRVAEFSPTQQQAFGATQQAANAYQPALGQATSAAQGLLGANALGQAQPYFSQAAGINAPSAASPYLSQSAGMNSVGAATPALQQGAQMSAQSANALGMQAAQPYLSAAGQTSVANIGQYMNPYTEQVVNRIGQLGARNLSENLMPAIEGRYIASGQRGYGTRQPGGSTPSGMMTDTARALRDTQEATLAQQAEALRQGYGEAATLSGTDLARQAQLGQFAGQLGMEQQGALARAGQQLANIGQTYGTLTADQQRTLADIGQTYGNLTAQQQQALANIGGQIGNIGANDIQNRLAASQQLGNLAESAQTLGLQGAGALNAIGTQQQQQAQANLDTAYQDYLRQQAYNQQQIDAAAKTLQGVAPAVPTGTQEYGIVPSGQPAEYKPGTAATIAGALSGAGSLISSLGKTFKL